MEALSDESSMTAADEAQNLEQCVDVVVEIEGGDSTARPSPDCASEWPELPVEDIELDKPAVTSAQPVCAGEQLCGKAYLNVFNDDYLRDTEVRVHVELEGDSWCCPRLVQSKPTPGQQQQQQQHTVNVVATAPRRQLSRESLNKVTSVTFEDDDYPKTFHFLKRTSVWPKRERGSVYSSTGMFSNRLLKNNLVKEGLGLIASPVASPSLEEKQHIADPLLLSATKDTPVSVVSEGKPHEIETSTAELQPSDSSTADRVTFGDGTLLGIGRHVWRFKLALPATLCSSAEVTCADGMGGVRYRLRTVMTICRHDGAITRMSPWTPVTVEQILNVPACQYQVPREHMLCSGEVHRQRQLRLPWSTFQLKAGLERSAYPRGSAFAVSVHLSRPYAGLVQWYVQAELLQRIRLNLGGKSVPWEQRQSQHNAMATGGLLLQFHSLCVEKADCGTAREFRGKLSLCAPQNMLATFRLPRVAVEYFVEVKVRHNFGNSKRSIVMPVVIGTNHDRLEVKMATAETVEERSIDGVAEPETPMSNSASTEDLDVDTGGSEAPQTSEVAEPESPMSNSARTEDLDVYTGGSKAPQTSDV
ncbi:uncharacterized protein LOC135815882 [Sycon ciliatum]|uniref:uncharacterized protein LOC135815882 n=1 Tax=Sycon ciliatum TaxID=27933 RepID=UPI0031F716BB